MRAPLLLLPVASMLAMGGVSRATAILLLTTVAVPMLLWVTLYTWYIVTYTVPLVASFGAMLYELWARERQPAPETGSTTSEELVPVALHASGSVD